MDWKTIKDNLENDKEELLSVWEKEWRKLPQGENTYYDDLFIRLFKDTYRYVKQRGESNKTKNFAWKYGFLTIFIIGLFLYIRFYQYLHTLNINEAAILGESALYLIFFSLLAAVVGKWIDIRKYQETWARHSTHRHLLEQEMLKFILEIGAYHGADKKKKFIMNIQKIWESNQKKFNRNMTEKEEELKDIIPKISDLKNDK